MKKLFIIAAVALCAVACNKPAEGEAAAADSTNVEAAAPAENEEAAAPEAEGEEVAAEPEAEENAEA